MHQFVIEPISGSFQANNPFVFTNSALWTLIVLGAITVFMLGGMKRELAPQPTFGGRWQVAVEGLISFVDDMVHASIGPEGRKFLPWVFTSFIFLLFANLMGNMPFGVIKAAHPFTVTSQFTFTGVMSLISFAIVLGVGFWKHGLHFFSLFRPEFRSSARSSSSRSSSSPSWCGHSASASGRSSPCSRATSSWTSSAISSSRA